MYIFWTRYKHSKLATFVSFLGMLVLIVGTFFAFSGLRTMFDDVGGGLVLILCGAPFIGLFFLIHKAAEKIADKALKKTVNKVLENIAKKDGSETIE